MRRYHASTRSGRRRPLVPQRPPGNGRCRTLGVRRRRGTSLAEVLAALLILGVGLLGVMSLFPIAIIRSLQATQLTNAMILSKRADELVDMYRLVTDSFIPQPEQGYETHCVIDPLGWHDMNPVNAAIADEYGNDGSGPVRYPMRFVQNQLARTQFVRIGADIVGGPVVNPAGGVTVGQPLRRLGFARNVFGNNSNPPTGPGPSGPYPAVGGLFGLPPSAVVRDTVLAAVGLPDTFEQAFVGEPTTVLSATGVSFATPTYDLSNVRTSSNIPSGLRVTLFDASGRRSQVRTFIDGDGDGTADPGTDGLVIAPNGSNWEITWNDPLPSGYGTISEVRVEFPKPRYSWMLTVRKKGISGGSVTKIDCVVFFNRPTGDPTQEYVYVANQTQGGVVGNGPPSEFVTIDYSSAPAKPRLKKGSWIFDPQNCVWYRVLETNNETATSTDLVLDRKAEEWIRNLIVPEGVVSVFPLPSRHDQKRLRAIR